MSYPEVIKYLESFINYEKIPAYPYKESCKLERIKGFLRSIGNPQDSLKVIHVAGSKGKGSTCVFIAYILRQAGYSVGLYTSPHLSDFRERIRILNRKAANSQTRKTKDFEGMIPENELACLVQRLKPAIEKFNRISKYGALSFFEVYTALAFTYFREQNSDFVVLETGLGGRLDATNAVNALVCAITPLSYEHTQKLGNTLKEIATEKAGIIKVSRLAGLSVSQLTRTPVHPYTRTPIVISAPQEKEAMAVIRNKCRKTGAKLYEINKDILLKKTTRGFKIRGIYEEYPGLEIKLLGSHQLINASVAVGVVEALGYYGIIIGIDSIRQGLYNAAWPGRCEVVAKNPFIVLDGAQNTASAKALKEAVKESFCFREKYKKLILVLGISKDKDIKGICDELNDLADEVILTKSDNPRAMEPGMLAKYFNHKKILITNSTKEAKIKALESAKKDDLILVTGSLFVVGEFRNGKI